MRSSRLWLITAVALGVMLNPLNTTVLSVAFSRLQEEFHVGYSSIAWLIATYYVASAVTQPVMGKIGDLFGRKRVFILGLAVGLFARVSQEADRIFNEFFPLNPKTRYSMMPCLLGRLLLHV
jgi:MFS family permease